MVAARVAALRKQVPILPGAWERADAFRPLLSGLITRESGTAAERDGQLIAFLAAWRFDARGEPSTFSPEWANGASGPDRRELIEALYAACADGWVRDGYRHHLVSLFADDGEAREAWHWIGFGEVAADAIRGGDPVTRAGDVAGLVVRRAGPGDLQAIATLEDGLRAHVAASPVFFRLGPPRPRDEQLARLSDVSTPIWLAELEGEATAYLRIGPASDDAATIIRDAETASISGAFTVPELRRGGIATELLRAAIGWAREQGYRRVAVDHETANLEASSFWRRHFTYVTHSLGRRLPPMGRPPSTGDDE